MFSYLNSEVRAVLDTGRVITGVLVAFDKVCEESCSADAFFCLFVCDFIPLFLAAQYMNVVLSEAIERRTRKWKGGSEEVERDLGFIILRGEHVVSLVVSGSLTGQAPPSLQTQRTNLRLPGEGTGMQSEASFISSFTTPLRIFQKQARLPAGRCPCSGDAVRRLRAGE